MSILVRKGERAGTGLYYIVKKQKYLTNYAYAVQALYAGTIYDGMWRTSVNEASCPKSA